MEAIYYSILVAILPFLFLLGFSFLPRKTRSLPKLSMTWPVILLVVLVFLIGLYPVELSTDKIRYVIKYQEAVSNNGDYEFRDPGWAVYNVICSKVFGQNEDLFFLTTALLYVGGLFFFAKRMFPGSVVGFFFVMSVGCLGYLEYGFNTIRAGLALSLLFISVAWDTNRVLRILLVLIAVYIHKSMFIPITAYMSARFIKNPKWAFGFWGVCMVLAVVNFDMSTLFENVGFIDERIESKTDGSYDGKYKTGFRMDFLIYSIIPILIAYYYLLKKKISDRIYNIILSIYLLDNAVWLLVIRIPYSNRVAYLSWFLIPLLTLYPVLKYPERFKCPLHVILLVMYMFMSVQLILYIRDF